MLALVATLVACSGDESTGTSNASGPPGSGSSTSGSPGASSSSGSITTPTPVDCEGGGVAYDVTKSKFAFGSTPTAQTSPDGTTRWTGTNGVLVIAPNGLVTAGTNGVSTDDWSDDHQALAAHVHDYFVSLGVPECQIWQADVHGGNVGTTIALRRKVDDFFLGESMAYAHMNRDDKTTDEGFYWPQIPAEALTSARAFRDRLATPDGLATYKAKLPTDAQGDGNVAFHHTSGAYMLRQPKKPFVAMATWDVWPASPSGSVRSYDENGQPVTMAW